MDAIIQHDGNPVRSLIARLRKTARGDSVTVREMVQGIGEHSFSALLFVVALVMVTPLSGIPTAPTLGAIVIGLIVVQWAIGRRHLWLPEWIAARSLDSRRFLKGLDWAEKPAAFVDRHTRTRLTPLARRPLKILPLAAILAIVATWPFLEILPFFTTLCAICVALFAFGLMTRDGLYVLAGFVYAGIFAGISAVWLI